MLKALTEQLNINLSESQLEQFRLYMNLLIEYNQKFNLTAITDPDEINLKHFYDCLVFADTIPDGARIADVGTGGGFPGLVIKIARPDVEITLMDSLNKRVGFLNTVVSELGLEGVSCMHIRAEDAGRDTLLRESFDLVTSRAVANMSVLSEYCLPLVKTGGIMAAMKGRNPQEELESAKPLVQKLGGRIENIFEYVLPGTDIVHSIVAVKKTGHTPKLYPRKGKKIGV